MYPRKQGPKKKAKESYLKAIKNGETTFEEVKKGLEMYIDYIKTHEISEEYIKHGSTWFNGQCWTDEYNLIKKRSSKKGFDSFLWNQLEELQDEKTIDDDFCFDFNMRGRNHEQTRDSKIVIDYQGDIPEPF